MSKFAGKRAKLYWDECARLLPLGQKLCTNCGPLSIKLFSSDRKRPDGLCSQCRTCITQQWRRQNGKPLLSQQQMLEHRERLLGETETNGYCVGCKRSRPLGQYFQHRQKYKTEYWAAWRTLCSDCIPLKLRTKRENVAKRSRIYKAEQRNLLWARRSIDSHRRRNIPVGDVVAADLAKLLDSSGFGLCFYTGDVVVVGFGASVDCKDPSLGLVPGNFCLCSHACNSMKRGLSEAEFRQYLVEQPGALQRIRDCNAARLKSYYAQFITLDVLRELANADY